MWISVILLKAFLFFFSATEILRTASVNREHGLFLPCHRAQSLSKVLKAPASPQSTGQFSSPKRELYRRLQILSCSPIEDLPTCQ